MKEENKKVTGITFSGDITVNGPMFDIHDNQHVHIYKKTANARTELCDCEYVDLKFFDGNRFGTIEQQDGLRSVLKRVLPRMDTDSGRDWVAIYIACHYSGQREYIMKGYADFFADIEGLLPGVLQRVNEAEQGDKRYKAYTDLLRLECANWFILDECLPPMREWTSAKYHYGVDDERKRRIQKIVKDIIQGLQDMAL